MKSCEYTDVLGLQQICRADLGTDWETVAQLTGILSWIADALGQAKFKHHDILRQGIASCGEGEQPSMSLGLSDRRRSAGESLPWITLKIATS